MNKLIHQKCRRNARSNTYSRGDQLVHFGAAFIKMPSRRTCSRKDMTDKNHRREDDQTDHNAQTDGGRMDVAGKHSVAEKRRSSTRSRSDKRLERGVEKVGNNAAVLDQQEHADHADQRVGHHRACRCALNIDSGNADEDPRGADLYEHTDDVEDHGYLDLADTVYH